MKEPGLNWAAMLSDLAETPVESIQFHYMRIARLQGKLAEHFPNAWALIVISIAITLQI